MVWAFLYETLVYNEDIRWKLNFYNPYLDAIFGFDNVGVFYSLNDECDVGGQCLHSSEGGDQRHRQVSVGIHISPDEKVLLQILRAEVIFAAGAGEKKETIVILIELRESRAHYCTHIWALT